MLSKKRYIVDIEDFIYGFKKNEKESEVMLNYRYYGNYYLKIEKNKHGKFLTIIKEKNNKREYIYNHENLYEVSYDFLKQFYKIKKEEDIFKIIFKKLDFYFFEVKDED